MNDLLRPALPLKHLSYVESTGVVHYSPPRSIPKVWDHALIFSVATGSSTSPEPDSIRLPNAGWFANALGNLNPKKDNQADPVEELTEKPRSAKWVKWRTLILRSWAVDPELCPRCHKEMKRARALLQQHELQRLLKNLGIGLYPTRPRSPPPPALDQDLAQESLFSECESQIPAGGTNGKPPDQARAWLCYWVEPPMKDDFPNHHYLPARHIPSTAHLRRIWGQSDQITQNGRGGLKCLPAF